MSWAVEDIHTTENNLEEDATGKEDFSIKKKLQHFLRSYSEGLHQVYREQIQEAAQSDNPCIEVSLDVLTNYDQSLGSLFLSEPERCLNLFEQAATEFASEFHSLAQPIQVLLTSSMTPTSMRDLDTSKLGKLFVIPGLVISASAVTAKATEIVAMCSGCKSHIRIVCSREGYTLPNKCRRQSENAGGPVSAGGACPNKPYIVLPDLSKFSDVQTLKIQESPEDVPHGDLPRHITATVDRALVNAVVPGSRHHFVCIFGVAQTSSTLQKPILRVVGLMKKAEKVSDAPDLEVNSADDLVKLFAPEIYGMEDVKKAILAQLFGSQRKILADQSIRRGDIHVLLLGDPSVAKSQLLKYAYRVSPIGVYTSGKGSSAAGLTASVIRQKGGEFFLEGGAMVLADGGVVCIDEFDKMNEDDRGAIHEAMEQQTISIAKAGITAVLNTRTAVLAAANPVYGRFDDLKTARENIDFQTSILSRFDLIFVLKDIKNEQRDRLIAQHVLNVHSQAIADTNLESLRKYIQKAKQRYSPRIGDSAMEKLNTEFVKMRSQINNDISIPITVRQLEALIRLTEALARMDCCAECEERHVDEALRLFKVSTFDAAQSGILAPEGSLGEEQKKEAELIERYVNKRCPLHSRVQEKALIAELQRSSFSDYLITRVLQTMIFTGQFEFQNQRRVLKRVMVPEEEE